MPESKRRPQAEVKKAAARRAEETEKQQSLAGDKLGEPNPPWFVPVMCALMILGVLWITTFYISEGRYPVQSWKYWNLAAGMGLLLSGFAMSTRWR